jgi:hypothetical protein
MNGEDRISIVHDGVPIGMQYVGNDIDMFRHEEGAETIIEQFNHTGKSP